MRHKSITSTNAARDMDIVLRHLNGESKSKIAKSYGLTPSRVNNICLEQKRIKLTEELEAIKTGKPFVYRIYVCSPLRAETPEAVAANRAKALEYEKEAQAAIRNLFRICMPMVNVQVRAFAPHGHMSVMLDDNYEIERKIALDTGLEILKICDAVAVGGNRISSGMKGKLIYSMGCGVYKKKAMLLVSSTPDEHSDEMFSNISDTVRSVNLCGYDFTGMGATSAYRSTDDCCINHYYLPLNAYENNDFKALTKQELAGVAVAHQLLHDMLWGRFENEDFIKQLFEKELKGEKSHV